MTPRERAKKEHKKFMIAAIIAATTIVSATAIVVSYNKYIESITSGGIIDDGIEMPASLNQTLMAPTQNRVKEILDGKELYATLASDDTRVYSIGTTKGTIIITRIATGVEPSQAEAIAKEKVGSSDSLNTYTFPEGSIWSNITGYQCIIAGQKMIMGYYINTDGYMYNITYSVPESDFEEQFPYFLELAEEFSFKESTPEMIKEANTKK